jgi:hypothetical protein
MKTNIIVRGKKFEELELDEQEEIKDKITNAQREIVVGKLVKMVKEGKIDEVRAYLEACTYCEEDMGEGIVNTHYPLKEFKEL